MYVPFEINGKLINCLLDSGCTTNLVSMKTIGTLGMQNKVEALNTGNPMTLGDALPSVQTDIIGKIQMNLGFHELHDPTRFYLVKELSKSIILGSPFVRKHRYEINFPYRTFYGRNVDSEILDIGTCDTYNIDVEMIDSDQFQRDLRNANNEIGIINLSFDSSVSDTTGCFHGQIN